MCTSNAIRIVGGILVLQRVIAPPRHIQFITGFHSLIKVAIIAIISYKNCDIRKNTSITGFIICVFVHLFTRNRGHSVSLYPFSPPSCVLWPRYTPPITFLRTIVMIAMM